MAKVGRSRTDERIDPLLPLRSHGRRLALVAAHRSHRVRTVGLLFYRRGGRGAKKAAAPRAAVDADMLDKDLEEYKSAKPT